MARKKIFVDGDIANTIHQVWDLYTTSQAAKGVCDIPLCSYMVLILRDYMAIRKGKPDAYLFCDQFGGMLSETALRQSITRYNNRRGVSKTSIHMFRHTFARKYLVDCGGDAFTLQRIMGHSTLKMTKHYCSIYDADIAKNYDRVSPSRTNPKAAGEHQNLTSSNVFEHLWNISERL